MAAVAAAAAAGMGEPLYDDEGFYIGGGDGDEGFLQPGQRPTLTGLPAWAEQVVWLAVIATFAWLGFSSGSSGGAAAESPRRGGEGAPRTDKHGFRESDLDAIAAQYGSQLPPTAGNPDPSPHRAGPAVVEPLRFRGVLAGPGRPQ